MPEGAQIVNLYRGVIDEVVDRVKTEFVQEGVDEATLDELRVLWETKLLQSGAINVDLVEHPPPHLDRGELQPQGGPTPAGHYVQPVPVAGLPHHGLADVPSSYAHQVGAPIPKLEPGMATGALPHIYTQGLPDPQSWLPGPEAGRDAMTYKRKHADAGPDSLGAEGLLEQRPHKQAALYIPQQDGAGDAPEEEASAKEPADGQEGAMGGAETLSDVESEVNLDEMVFSNVVLAQFEKVNHIKHRWKCQLKDGVMHLNGKDYVFHKASGEMQF